LTATEHRSNVLFVSRTGTQKEPNMSKAISLPAARRKGMKAEVFTGAELFDLLPADGSISSFVTSFGPMNGVEMFRKEYCRRGDGRVEIVTQHVEDKGAWRVIASYPFDRKVRLLTR
jgi:hypothetical protein